MGGWIGGQADYVMVPYADFNLLKFPDKALVCVAGAFGRFSHSLPLRLATRIRARFSPSIFASRLVAYE
jgi:hypothetical protein